MEAFLAGLIGFLIGKGMAPADAHAVAKALETYLGFEPPLGLKGYSLVEMTQGKHYKSAVVVRGKTYSVFALEDIAKYSEVSVLGRRGADLDVALSIRTRVEMAMNLSDIIIDVNKDWNGFRIENLGSPLAAGHALRMGDESIIDHDTLKNFVAAEHLSLPNTIASVLTNHDLTRHPLSIIPTMDLAHIPSGIQGKLTGACGYKYSHPSARQCTTGYWAWAYISGKPGTYPPSAHTHPAGDITSGDLAKDRMSLNALVRDPNYDSGWFSVGAGSSVTKTHNLGTLNTMVYMEHSANSGGSNARQTPHIIDTGVIEWYNKTTTQITARNSTVGSTYVRIVMWKLA